MYTLFVLVSLAQLVWTMHNVCKVQCSNPGHHYKIKNIYHYLINQGHVMLYINLF